MRSAENHLSIEKEGHGLCGSMRHSSSRLRKHREELVTLLMAEVLEHVEDAPLAHTLTSFHPTARTTRSRCESGRSVQLRAGRALEQSRRWTRGAGVKASPPACRREKT